MTAVRILTMICMGILLQLLPSWIMKKKNKSDIAEKHSILIARVFAEISYLCANAAVAIHEEDVFQFFFLSVVMMLSAAIIIIDVRCRIIPNICLALMLIACVGYRIRLVVLGGDPLRIVYGVLSMIVMCAVLQLLTAMLKFQGCLGAGDVKFLSVGAFLFTFSSQIIGLLAGLIISMLIYLVPMMLMKKITLKSMIAFGPFIGFGMMGGICWMYL